MYCVLNMYYVAGIVLMMWYHSIITTISEGRYYYSHVTDEEHEAHKASRMEDQEDWLSEKMDPGPSDARTYMCDY